MKGNTYNQVKQAKYAIKQIGKEGYCATKEEIAALADTLPPLQKEILLIGRFILKYRGWVFEMPSTAKILSVLESGGPERTEILFVEDEEG